MAEVNEDQIVKQLTMEKIVMMLDKEHGCRGPPHHKSKNPVHKAELESRLEMRKKYSGQFGITNDDWTKIPESKLRGLIKLGKDLTTKMQYDYVLKGSEDSITSIRSHMTGVSSITDSSIEAIESIEESDEAPNVGGIEKNHEVYVEFEKGEEEVMKVLNKTEMILQELIEITSPNPSPKSTKLYRRNTPSPKEPTNTESKACQYVKSNVKSNNGNDNSSSSTTSSANDPKYLYARGYKLQKRNTKVALVKEVSVPKQITKLVQRKQPSPPIVPTPSTSNSTSSSKNSSTSSKSDDPIMNAAKEYQTPEEVEVLRTKSKRTSLKQVIKDFRMELNQDEEVKIALKKHYIEGINSRTSKKQLKTEYTKEKIAHTKEKIAHKEIEYSHHKATATSYDYITAVAKAGAKKF